MGIINQLDMATANLIAAGEVVDRPASACKELLENAIDAGATVVTVEIKRGGVSMIRVSDNGKGMAREDVPLAIKRHATSKIATADDLSGIRTLGFRGEALAAISAVSHIRILTKRREDLSGTELDCEPGREPVLREIAISDGTTIIVENLFENVPVRRKFLKTDKTEAMAVTSTLERVALSYPAISVRLIIDGQMKFATAGDNRLKNSIYSIYGREFSSRLIPIDQTHDEVRAYGFIGTPDNVRANRNYQTFFVNRRYVKSKCITAALEQAYTSYAPADKFPSCVIFVDLAPEMVDVNIHPTKLEVKFESEKLVFEAVYYAVRAALETRIAPPQLKIGSDDPVSSKYRAKQQEILNSFIPLEDRRSSQPKPAYQNLKNIKEGQLSINDADANLVKPSVGQTAHGISDTPRTSAPVAANIPENPKISERIPERPTYYRDPPRRTANDFRNFPQNAANPSQGASGQNLSAADDDGSKYFPEAIERLTPQNRRAKRPDAPEATDFLPDFASAPPFVPSVPPTAPTGVQAKTQTQTEAPAQAKTQSRIEIPAQPEAAVPGNPAGSCENPPAAPISDADVQPLPDFPAEAPENPRLEFDRDGKPLLRLIGELFYSYIIAEYGSKVYMIDKHAAHERIIFEELRQNLRNQKVDTQMMLVPLSISLTPDELQAVREHKNEISKIGFDFELRDSSAEVAGIPQSLDVEMARAFFETVAGQLAGGTGVASISGELFFEKALYQASCKAAIKAGRLEGDESLLWICKRLFALPDIRFCPHGRPVALEITKASIERQFKRT